MDLVIQSKEEEKQLIELLFNDAFEAIPLGSYYSSYGEWVVVKVDKHLTKKSFDIIKDVTFWPEFYKGVIVLDKKYQIKYIVVSENKLPKVVTLKQAIKNNYITEKEVETYEYNYIKHKPLKIKKLEGIK